MAGGLFAWQTWAAIQAPLSERFADLQVYDGAVRLWSEGGSPYDYGRHNGDVFTYPPFAAVLLSWLARTPYSAAIAIWSALTFLASFAMSWACARRESQNDGQKRTDSLVLGLVLVVVLAASPGRSNIAFGQFSVMMVALALVDLLLVQRGRAGWLLGVSAAAKLTTLIFIPFLWLVGRRRDAVRAGLVTVGISALTWLLFPAESRRYWLHELTDTSRIVHTYIPGNQSLRAVLERAEIPHATTLWAASCLVILLAALAGSVGLARRGHYLHAVITMGAASILLSPISWTHHQYWLALGCVLSVLTKPVLNWTWRALVLLVMFTGPGAVDLPIVGWPLTNAHFMLAAALVLMAPLLHRRQVRHTFQTRPATAVSASRQL